MYHIAVLMESAFYLRYYFCQALSSTVNMTDLAHQYSTSTVNMTHCAESEVSLILRFPRGNNWE